MPLAASSAHFGRRLRVAAADVARSALERGVLGPEEVGDRVDRDIRELRLRVLDERCRIVRIVTLPREDGRHALTPGPLHRGEDPQLVVDEDVATRRKTSLD